MIDLRQLLRVVIGDRDFRSANCDDAIAYAIFVNRGGGLRDWIIDAPHQVKRPRKQHIRAKRQRRRKKRQSGCYQQVRTTHSPSERRYR